MPESDVRKSCIGIKHPRSESVILYCDAEKLLQVIRGFSLHTSGDAGWFVNLKREYVEDAQLIHEDVFNELYRVFPHALQLQRLCLLDGMKTWDGWDHIKSSLLSSQSHDMTRVHVE